LALSFLFTEMQLHSVGLRTLPPTAQPSAANPTQLNALLSSLEAGKRFLDLLMAFPVSDYHLISFSEWMRLPSVVMTMARLSIPSEAHAAAQWDVKAAQDRVRLDLYLESLCYRMQSLSTFEKAKQPHPDFWWAMRMIMDLTRSWYCRKTQAKNQPSNQPTSYNLPTADTLHNLNHGNAEIHGIGQTATIIGTMDCPWPAMGGISIGNHDQTHHTSNPDAFAFMRSMDFDMDQFLDIGIWGSETYEGMGFGGGGMSF
jgi:hypothetical protein